MGSETPSRGSPPAEHSVAREPKFCRCRLCHEHFYGETIVGARDACLAHQRQAHPDWSEAVCYCPE